MDSRVPLHLTGVRAAYAGREALHGIDLALMPGEVYALVGPNGAGKSTVARLACGLIAPSAGSVRVGGADPRRNRAARRSIGMAPQEVALHLHLSVRENLEVFAALAGVPRGERATHVERAMRLGACAQAADERVSRLSGGWRRRANIAAAMVHAPKLLVLDEPTEGVDAATRADMVATVREAVGDGSACFLISHDAAFVQRVADRVGILHAGSKRTEGRLAELLAARFGGRRQLLVRFDSAPSALSTEALVRCGLRGSADALSWDCFDASARELSVTLGQALAPADAAELTVRNPSLDDLIRAVARES